MDKKKRFIELSWKILEAKAYYYIHNSNIMEDYDYDQIEKEYDNIADELGLIKTASDMVGFDINRPSCQLVLAKIKKTKHKKIVNRA